MDDTPHFWSAPAERTGDGALAVPQHRAKRSKAGSRFACPRTPKPLARQPNVAHPTVPSVSSGRMAWRIHESVQRGEIDNRVRGVVRGKIWLHGLAEPVTLDLKGNACPDLAGFWLTFENPGEFDYEEFLRECDAGTDKYLEQR